MATAQARTACRCRWPGAATACRRRTRCRRVTRPVRRRSRSGSDWRARRWAWGWRCWPAWWACPGWRPARTIQVTCSPGSASARASRCWVRGWFRRVAAAKIQAAEPLRVDTARTPRRRRCGAGDQPGIRRRDGRTGHRRGARGVAPGRDCRTAARTTMSKRCCARPPSARRCSRSAVATGRWRARRESR